MFLTQHALKVLNAVGIKFASFENLIKIHEIL